MAPPYLTYLSFLDKCTMSQYNLNVVVSLLIKDNYLNVLNKKMIFYSDKLTNKFPPFTKDGATNKL